MRDFRTREMLFCGLVLMIVAGLANAVVHGDKCTSMLRQKKFCLKSHATQRYASIVVVIAACVLGLEALGAIIRKNQSLGWIGFVFSVLGFTAILVGIFFWKKDVLVMGRAVTIRVKRDIEPTKYAIEVYYNILVGILFLIYGSAISLSGIL